MYRFYVTLSCKYSGVTITLLFSCGAAPVLPMSTSPEHNHSTAWNPLWSCVVLVTKPHPSVAGVMLWLTSATSSTSSLPRFYTQKTSPAE